jgi:hypothetical protein
MKEYLLNRIEKIKWLVRASLIAITICLLLSVLLVPVWHGNMEPAGALEGIAGAIIWMAIIGGLYIPFASFVILAIIACIYRYYKITIWPLIKREVIWTAIAIAGILMLAGVIWLMGVYKGI